MSCSEHDSNIDALLDRRNHTGTQSASTIYDLKTTVLRWPEIEALMQGNESLVTQLQSLRDEVFSSTGHVQQLINNLETRLNAALSTEVSRINTLVSQLTSLTSQVNELKEDLQGESTRIDNLSSRITANDVDNNALWDAIGGRGTNRLMLPQPRWQGEVPGKSNILFLQYDTLMNVVYWAPPPIVNGGWVGSYKFGAVAPGILDFGELKARDGTGMG